MKLRCILLVSILYCVQLFNGLPAGAPFHSCINPTPIHMMTKWDIYTPVSTPSSTSSGVTITPSSSTYTINTDITITIASTSSFKGYLLRAAPTDANFMPNTVGAFKDCTPSNVKYLSYPDASVQSCVTQNSSTDVSSFTCVYTPPATYVGSIKISMVVIRSYTEVWINTETTLNPAVTAYTSPTLSYTTLSSLPDMGSCGSSKNCLLYPRPCNPSSTCERMVSWRYNGSSVIFEAVMRDYGWIALSISADTKMPDALDVFALSPDTGNPAIQVAYGATMHIIFAENTAVTNQKVIKSTNQNGVKMIGMEFELPMTMSYSYLDGMLNQTISRDLNFMDNSYYPLFGFGTLIQGTRTPLGHTEIPIRTDMAVKFSDTTWKTYYGVSLSNNIKGHGTMATLALLFFMPIATIIMSNFKPKLNREVASNMPIFIIVHIILVILSFLLGAGAIIIVLVVNQKWKDKAMAHGIMACITVFIMILQIVTGPIKIALKNTKTLKYIVGAIHRVCGWTVRLCSLAVFWLAIMQPGLTSNFQLYGQIVVGIWTAFEFISLVYFFTKRSYKYQQYLLEFADKKYHGLIDEKKTSRNVANSGAFSFALYFICFLGLTVAFLVGIWIY